MSRERDEIELSEHIRKAVALPETAPKQKHVRMCIVFAFDHKTSVPFWRTLATFPFEEVTAFKALVVIHKLLVNGPNICLIDAQKELSFLDALGRFNSHYGYFDLSQIYVRFLKSKLEFHRYNPSFTGNFDFEEFKSKQKADNPYEAFQIISDLLDLFDKLDSFQQRIFGSLRGHTELKISSLVPLVEESYGIYKFLTSLLTSLFGKTDPEPLLMLESRYRTQFFNLKRFYKDCRNLKYLTSLIAVPELPENPPVFYQKKSSPQKSAQKVKQNPAPLVDDLFDNQNQMYDSPVQERMPPADVVPMKNFVQLQNELSNYKQRFAHDQHVLQSMQQQIAQRDQQLVEMRKSQLTIQSSAAQEKKNEEDLIAQWKAKCEKMMKLYQDLRKDHLNLLNKVKTMKTLETQNANLKEEMQLIRTTSDLKLEKLNLENSIKATENSFDRQKFLDAAKALSQVQMQFKDSLNSLFISAESRLKQTLLDFDLLTLDVPSAHGSSFVERALECLSSFEERLMAKFDDESPDLISAVNDLTHFIDQMLQSCKYNEHVIESSKQTAAKVIELYSQCRSFEYKDKNKERSIFLSFTADVSSGLNKVLSRIDEMQPKQDLEMQNEMKLLSESIAAAIKKLSEKATMDKNPIYGEAVDMGNAISLLIRQAIVVQHEIVLKSGQPTTFYKKNNRWTQGLISAAKSVGDATNLLAESVDNPQRMKAASKQVVFATTQLVTASRVKAGRSESQLQLERAAKVVNDLSKKFNEMTVDEVLSMPAMTEHEQRIAEMDLQVSIIDLEDKLRKEQQRLLALRQSNYQK